MTEPDKVEPDKFAVDLRQSIAEKRAALERLRQELDRDERTLAARLDMTPKQLRRMLGAEVETAASSGPQVGAETP